MDRNIGFKRRKDGIFLWNTGFFYCIFFLGFWVTLSINAVSLVMPWISDTSPQMHLKIHRSNSGDILLLSCRVKRHLSPEMLGKSSKDILPNEGLFHGDDLPWYNPQRITNYTNPRISVGNIRSTFQRSNSIETWKLKNDPTKDIFLEWCLPLLNHWGWVVNDHTLHK